eukprot:1155839-Pelagomonas_calceolata.AAC.11
MEGRSLGVPVLNPDQNALQHTGALPTVSKPKAHGPAMDQSQASMGLQEDGGHNSTVKRIQKSTVWKTARPLGRSQRSLQRAHKGTPAVPLVARLSLSSYLPFD